MVQNYSSYDLRYLSWKKESYMYFLFVTKHSEKDQACLHVYATTDTEFRATELKNQDAMLSIIPFHFHNNNTKTDLWSLSQHNVLNII